MFSNLMPVMGILSKKVIDLTDSDLLALAEIALPGVILTPEMKATAFSILKAENIDAVADVLAKPKLLQSLAAALVPSPSPPGVVRQCKHCENFNMV